MEVAQPESIVFDKVTFATHRHLFDNFINVLLSFGNADRRWVLSGGGKVHRRALLK